MPFCKEVSCADSHEYLKILTKTPSVQDTVVPLHSEPEPTPTTEIGLQVKPRRTLRSLMSMPIALRMAAPAAELAYKI